MPSVHLSQFGLPLSFNGLCDMPKRLMKLSVTRVASNPQSGWAITPVVPFGNTTSSGTIHIRANSTCCLGIVRSLFPQSISAAFKSFLACSDGWQETSYSFPVHLVFWCALGRCCPFTQRQQMSVLLDVSQSARLQSYQTSGIRPNHMLTEQPKLCCKPTPLGMTVSAN